ncbi:alkaline shock response membrane anchor protein AmaP [Streptomyces sp. NBC_00237]|uniref:alkaline shock response membrane anchor protein AmaP n=1 Tax=Streptomyces sp. NBC_00237 TaxID=2975687 RepID=UPI002255EE95|nr:alkaline shock response membrane anchor protein AmaP [Streptomyces sp. NBC_00237]MCX5202048.1 alkaline shock response membrane anchor protein AmaP [Streptomyces sp. NBC_00237]
MRNPVNRVLLGLLGLLLLLLGGTALTAGLAGSSLPSWWPFSGRDDVLLSVADRTRWRGEGWWWPVVIATLSVCAVLALWWLLVQMRQKRLGVVRVGSEGEAVLLRGRALERVLGDEVEAVPGVERARVLLTGRQNAPRARISVQVTGTAVPAWVVSEVDGVALVRAQQSIGSAHLPAEVTVRARGRRAR